MKKDYNKKYEVVFNPRNWFKKYEVHENNKIHFEMCSIVEYRVLRSFKHWQDAICYLVEKQKTPLDHP